MLGLLLFLPSELSLQTTHLRSHFRLRTSEVTSDYQGDAFAVPSVAGSSALGVPSVDALESSVAGSSALGVPSVDAFGALTSGVPSVEASVTSDSGNALVTSVAPLKVTRDAAVAVPVPSVATAPVPILSKGCKSLVAYAVRIKKEHSLGMRLRHLRLLKLRATLVRANNTGGIHYGNEERLIPESLDLTLQTSNLAFKE